jgi:hypothetical protein
MDAIFPPCEADRREGADDQEACRDHPHPRRIGSGSDDLDPEPTGNKTPSRQ